MILKYFFQVMIKNTVQGIEVLTERIQDIKINDYIFLGNDLAFEQKFLNEIVKVCHEKIKDCDVSFHLSKRSMHVCCEMLTLTTTNVRMLLDIVHYFMNKYFCDSLSKLGWCAHYMLDRRSLVPFRTTRITDFYWFNNSLNKFN